MRNVKWLRWDWMALLVIALLPWIDRLLPPELLVAPYMPRIFIFAVLAMGLNIVVGYCGLLHLGLAAFFAIGIYAYAILTTALYPFQTGFWLALIIAPLISAVCGIVLGLPTLHLRGDYLAIVTMGFGEIMKDVLKNLEPITKGTQGINPLPGPRLPGYEFTIQTLEPWYYLFLAFVVGLVILNQNLERSRLGRMWVAIREDELAASCMGINPARVKLTAFAIGSAFAGLAGVMWASFLTTSGDPGRYDFNLSVTALCIVIIGGIGNIYGILLGSVILMGFDTVLVNKLSEWLQRQGMEGGTNVFLAPTNWKWLLFGLALVLMMRFRREGILPSCRLQAELAEEPAEKFGETF